MVFHDTGSEYEARFGHVGATVTVGLYDQQADALGESSDLGEVNTEPDGNDYTRQTTTLSGSVSGTDYVAANPSTVRFDLADATNEFDSYFLAISFESDLAGDSSPTEHLLASEALDGRYDSEKYAQIDLNTGQIGVSF